MSKMRWADSSSDEDEKPIRVPVFQQSGFNDGVVQPILPQQQAKRSNAIVPILNRNRFGDSEEVEDDVDADDESEDSKEEDHEDAVENRDNLVDGELQRQEELRKAREIAVQLKKQKDTETMNKKPLSKKEKQALKAKEMDDLDQLLNEMGLSVSNHDTQIMGNDTLDNSSQNQGPALEITKSNSGTTTSKKKKKKIKDTVSGVVTTEQIDFYNLNEADNNTSTKTEESVSANTLIDDDIENTSNSPTLDVASLLKAKAPKKVKKSAADIAAATAAKEALAKKELAAKNQKKKNKDKYPFGGPNR